MKRIAVIAILMGASSTAMLSAPRARLLPDAVVELGEFEEREVQTREIYLKNTGDEPLVILKHFSTCSCTTVSYSSAPIAPGDSTLLTVTFDGRHRRPGPVRKVFRLTTNAETPLTSVLVKGEIIRPFQK